MWNVLGGSATGKSHGRSGSPCQDAHGWLISPGGAVCLAVADGAGSRPHSAAGSAAAVDAVLAWAGQITPAGSADAGGSAGHAGGRGHIGEAFAAAKKRVIQLAEELDMAEGDLATTLGVVLVTDGRVQIGQIGDSIVIVTGPERGLHAVCPAPRMEYANETIFLTNPDSLEHLRVAVLDEDEVDGMALSTDGLRMKILDDPSSGRPYEPFFEDVFKYARSGDCNSGAVASFIDGLDDQTFDDKTLVVAVKGEFPDSSAAGETLVLNEFLVIPVDPPLAEPPLAVDDAEGYQ